MQYSLMEQSILQMLVYFDVRGVPLTVEEVGRYLWWSPSPNGAITNQSPPVVLENLQKLGVVEEKFGLYFLKGRSELVEKRRASGIFVEQKLRRAQKAARLLRFVPYIRAVLVCNSVAEETAAPESDIDVLIVADVNRIWIVRFFSNLLLKVFRLRTGKNYERDRICLSYFIDANHLGLGAWRVAKDDVHLAYWLHQMLPVYDVANFYERILQANSWTREYLPGLLHARTNGSALLIPDSKIAKFWRGFWERAWGGAYGKMVENEAKKFQMTILEKRLGTKVNAPGFGVIIQNGIIKLHERDTRFEIREKWKKKVEEFLNDR